MRPRSISWAFALLGAGAMLATTTLAPKADAAPAASGKASPTAAPAKKQAAPPATKSAPKTGKDAQSKAGKASEKAPAKKGATPAKGAKGLEADRALDGEKIGGGKDSQAKRAGAKGTASGTGTRPQRTASTQPGSKTKAGAKGKKKPAPPCFRPQVELLRGFQRAETETVALTYCDGKVAPDAVEHLSLLARPKSAPRPKKLPNTPPPGKATGKVAQKGKGKAPPAKPPQGSEWAPGVKLMDEGLVTRLQKVVDRFGAKRVFVISGYRPESERSFHQSAKALDFHLEGVRNEEVVAFCRTLPDTGCGYYPNSSFVHMDVRPPKTGHIYWIDASGPGETPRYVSSWPPKEGEPDTVTPAGADIEGEKRVADSAPRKAKAATDVGEPAESPSLLDVLGADLAKEPSPPEPPAEADE